MAILSNLVEALGVFNDGYRSWNEGKWDQAVKLFKQVQKINPKDKAAQLYWIDKSYEEESTQRGMEWRLGNDTK